MSSSRDSDHTGEKTESRPADDASDRQSDVDFRSAGGRKHESAKLKQNIEWPLADSERYTIDQEHARGGIGRILEANDLRLDRPVAIKELLTDAGSFEARFIREALVTARLQHPAIVPIHEVGRWPNGKPFYVMKLVSGRSFSEVIKERRTLDERLELIPNIITVADAVAYAHEQKVIHRDLKPSHILLGRFGETVVIDWGLAADLDAEHGFNDMVESPYEIAVSQLTIAGSVMGTPEYMPPEASQR